VAPDESAGAPLQIRTFATYADARLTGWPTTTSATQWPSSVAGGPPGPAPNGLAAAALAARWRGTNPQARRLNPNLRRHADACRPALPITETAAHVPIRGRSGRPSPAARRKTSPSQRSLVQTSDVTRDLSAAPILRGTQREPESSYHEGSAHD